MGIKLAPGGRRRRLALIRGANGRVLALSVDLLASLQSPKLGLKQTYSRRRFSADVDPSATWACCSIAYAFIRNPATCSVLKLPRSKPGRANETALQNRRRTS